MDVKETNTILRYKRPCDSWLCPDCDTENNISLGKCTVCGYRKSPSATILKQWTETDDRPVTPPNERPTYLGPDFNDTSEDYYIPEKENKNKIIWGILFAIIIIGLLIAASQEGTYAASSDVMNEFNSDSYEITMANGTHYHSDDNEDWEKQLMYQKIDNISVSGYDFADCEIYNLSRN